MLCSAMAALRPRMVRGSTGPSATARTGESFAGGLGQRAVHPAAVGGLQPGRAGFHVVLRVEMRARGVGRAGRVDDRQVPLVEQRLERRERRDAGRRSHPDRWPHPRACRGRGGPRNGDGGAQIVVRLLAVRHHDVQSVGGAALENGDQNLLARRRRVRRRRAPAAATAAPRRPPPWPAPNCEGKSRRVAS